MRTHTAVSTRPANVLDTLYRITIGGRPRGAIVQSPCERLSSDGYRRLDPVDLAGPDPVVMTSSVLRAVESSVGAMRAEQGGMFGGRRERGTITTYRFDDAARRTSATYTPSTSMLNALLREQWNPAGIDFLGFVHSHPRGMWRPSNGDCVYAERILKAIPAMDRLFLPIAQTRPDTRRFTLHPYVARREPGGVVVDSVPLVVVPDQSDAPTLSDAAFDRVHDAYDLSTTAATRLVVVGVGGAAAFVESMARAGIGEFVLIDPDTIDLPNIATQHVSRRDAGRPKVDAVADRILDINPHARVIGVQAYLDDLDDDMMRRLTHRPLPHSTSIGPSTSILCGFTDNFWAQARVNRLALHLGVPMVAAQVYEHGHGVEVSFHVPGYSVACGRCVLGGRYRAHLERAYTNTVTSHGTPLWATERLNELKAQVVLAIIHGTGAGTAHPATERYANLLHRIATHNLVQVRLDPEANLPAFARAFASPNNGPIITDDTLWLLQEPEGPATGFGACGDCGGFGDLKACIGTFTDTRLLSPT